MEAKLSTDVFDMDHLPAEVEQPKPTLANMIYDLHALRQKKEQLTLEKNRRQMEFDQKNAALHQDISGNAEAIAALEQIIKTEAVAVFEATGNKTPEVGVNVKEVKQPAEYDTDAAMQWARVNAPIYIVEQFDSKGFGGYLKTAKAIPDFVTIPDPKPRAEIASDLRSAVGEVA